MVYDSSPLVIQEMLLHNYYTFGKIFLLSIIFIWSLWFVFLKYPNLKPSNLFLIGTKNLVVYVASRIYIWFYPLLILFYLHPKVSFEPLLVKLLSLYDIVITIFFVMLIVIAFMLLTGHIRFKDILKNINLLNKNANPEYKSLKSYISKYLKW